jgi:hypothetical protein
LYPAYTVQAGDHFLAWIGCLADSPGCRVTFSLQYRIGDGPVETLATWQEKYDGKITEIALDLSSLAGQEVEFILSVSVNGGTPANANAFWFLPHIRNLP